MPDASEVTAGFRYVVVSTDGRCSTLGWRARPTPTEIYAVEFALSLQGRSGWLAILEGGTSADPEVTLSEVHPLVSPPGTFEDAARACIKAMRWMGGDVREAAPAAGFAR